MSKICKKGYMEMRKWIYLETLKSVLRRSILHYWSSIAFKCCSFLPSKCFSILKDSSFFSSSFKPLFKNLLNGEYSNLACSAVLGLRPRSAPVRYSYLLKLLEDNADILASFLSKSYCASFYIIFLPKILI